MRNIYKIPLIVFTIAFFVGCILGCSLSSGKTSVDVPVGNVAENVQETDVDGSSAGLENGGYVPSVWDEAKAPNGYLVEGNAVVNHEVAPGEYVYAGIDELGRTMQAYARITPSDYARELGEERESFKSDADKISGWGYNQKCSLTFPSGKVYNGYFYNRSHLIADSLGGTPARENLVTGTRFQNVGDNNGGGIGYIEEKVRQWLASASESANVYYAVTPVYQGDELVPRSVFVDVLTSDGIIDEHVEVFNVSGDVNNAYSVDYSTGEIIQ